MSASTDAAGDRTSDRISAAPPAAVTKNSTEESQNPANSSPTTTPPDEPPSNIDETEPDEPPVKPDEPPAKLDEPPAKLDEPPATSTEKAVTRWLLDIMSGALSKIPEKDNSALLTHSRLTSLNNHLPLKLKVRTLAALLLTHTSHCAVYVTCCAEL